MLVINTPAGTAISILSGTTTPAPSAIPKPRASAFSLEKPVPTSLFENDSDPEYDGGSESESDSDSEETPKRVAPIRKMQQAPGHEAAGACFVRVSCVY